MEQFTTQDVRNNGKPPKTEKHPTHTTNKTATGRYPQDRPDKLLSLNRMRSNSISS